MLIDARSDLQAAVDCRSGACESNDESRQVPPFNASMFFGPDLAVPAYFRLDVEVRHVLELEHRLFA